MDKKNKIGFTNPAVKRITELNVSLERIEAAFVEFWPLIEHFDVEGFAAIQYYLGLQEADNIAVYLCGLVQGISHQSGVLREYQTTDLA